MTNFLTAFAAILALVYCIGAFIAWDFLFFLPALATAGDRAVSLFMVFIIAWAVFMISD